VLKKLLIPFATILTLRALFKQLQLIFYQWQGSYISLQLAVSNSLIKGIMFFETIVDCQFRTLVRIFYGRYLAKTEFSVLPFAIVETLVLLNLTIEG